MFSVRLKPAEMRELKRLLSVAGQQDIHFTTGLLTAFACVDGSAEIDFILDVLWGGERQSLLQDSAFVDLLQRFGVQLSNELYEYRYKLPPKTPFNVDDFESNFSKDNPIANWARGLHIGLAFCFERAQDQGEDVLASVYQQLLGFSTLHMFIFIDADVARAVYQESGFKPILSLEGWMQQSRRRLTAHIRDLIEMAYDLIMAGPANDSDAVLWGSGEECIQPPEGFNFTEDTDEDLGAIDILLQQAELEKNKKRRIQLFEQATNMGRAQLGSDFFQNNVGFFWGLIETRPFMRALASLADAYRQAHMREKSLDCYQECLRLCPNDNLGVRYLVPAIFMEMGRFGEARELLEGHTDEMEYSAFLAYSMLLCLIAQGAAKKSIVAALQVATGSNTYVPALLLSDKPLPEADSPYCASGDRNEAIFYVSENRMLWRNVKNALGYLAGC